MITWFARNHVAANLLMVTLLLAGLLSLRGIPLEVFPSFESDRISVNVSLRGSTPEEVEEAIAIRIEEAVQDLEGVEEIRSTSLEGSAQVSIEVEQGYEPRELLADIKSRVDAINTFPADAEKPVISLFIHTREVISVAVSGPYSEEEIRQQAEQIRDDLLRLPGITQVKLDAVRDYEIAIEVPERNLRQYKLTLDDVAQAIARSSIDLSAGNIKTLGGDVLIRAKGQAYQRDDFESIVVKTQTNGSLIRVRDIARVRDGFEDDPMRARFNGKSAAFVDVYRVGGQSAIDVADKVKTYVAERREHLPQGYELAIWRDRSLIVEKRLQTLVNNALQGGILVMALLTLFLRPTVAIWVFVGVPVSFMGALLFMPLLGITLNIISLFGFILVLGIVVDDAIVTGENVYRHLQTAETGLEAAVNGTKEVAVPVTFGVLTTAVAFLPIAFIEGFRGALFAQIPAVIIPILLFSLLESKLVLPAHLKNITLRNDRTPSKLQRWQQRFADRVEAVVLSYYRPALNWGLHHRYLTLTLFIGTLMVIVALSFSGWIRFTFFPRVQSEVASATLEMPAGTPFEVTDRYIQAMADAAMDLKAQFRQLNDGEDVILDIQATTGQGDGSRGTHVGRVRFEIAPPEERRMSVTSSELVKQWRQNIGEVPGAESLNFRAEIGRGSDPISIQFMGNDYRVLAAVAEETKRMLGRYPQVFDIGDSLSDGKEELQIELRNQAYALGLTRADIINQVRQAFYGHQVQRIQRGRDDIRVMVRYPESERSAVSNLADLRIKTSDGRQIPLSQVAELKPGKSPTAITRINRYRTLTVFADFDKKNANAVVLNREIKEFLDQLVVQYPGVHYELEGEAKEQRESFGSLKVGIVVVLFSIYALLAIPFKSYWQPLVVMSVIPFGVIGAVVGHCIMGMDLTFFSILGLLGLVGVVVNDSLVLVDFINRRRLEGCPVREAVLNAGVVRFRPVLLTSMTTFIGLMPLLFEQSTQAQFLIPMAVSLGFGILFATFVTLILVPINYMLMDDARLFLQGAKREKVEVT